MRVPRSPRGPVRRWVRRFSILSVVTLVLMGLLIGFAPQLIARTALKDRVIALAGGSLNGSLTVETLSLGWMRPVEVEGIRIVDSAKKPAIEVAAVRTDKTLWQLATAGGDYGTITVERPVIHAVLTADSSNLEEIFAKLMEPSSESQSSGRVGVAVEVTDGKLILAGNALPSGHVFEGIQCSARVPVSDQEPMTVAAELATSGFAKVGRVDLHASIGPSAVATLHVMELPLEAFEPLTTRFAPGTQAAGRLGADLHVTRSAGDKPVTHLNGTVGVDALAATGPWTNQRPVQFERITMAVGSVDLAGEGLAIHDANLTCDAGRLTATTDVNLADPVGGLLATPGLLVNVDLNAAKLAAAMPGVLHLKPGTELTSGRLAANVTSTAGAAGIEWTGNLTASDIRGIQEGRQLTWEKPLAVMFQGYLRASDGLPVFEKLQCEADFIGLAGRGSAEQFLLMANVDLNRLAQRLGDFVDLDGMSFGGIGQLTVRSDTGPDGTFQAQLRAEIDQFRFMDGAGPGLVEPRLELNADAAANWNGTQTPRLESLAVTITAAGDRAGVRLVEPIADLRSITTGVLQVGVDGELARWRARAAGFATIPPEWVISGSGPIRATVHLTETGARVEAATATLTQPRFEGAGMVFAEPTLNLVTDVTWTQATGEIELANLNVNCPTITLATPSVRLENGSVRTDATVQADLAGIARTLQLQTPMAGQLKGTVGVKPVDGGIGFDSALRVEQFLYGPHDAPTWAEPWVVLNANGSYADSALSLPQFQVGRDGLTLNGQATLKELDSTLDLKSSGMLSYDLAKLEPQLRELVGETLSVQGVGERPFQAQGSLANLGTLSAEAGLNWQTLKAYGFDVGQAELIAKVGDGKARTNPIRASFAGGTVQLEPTVDLTQADYPLVLTPGMLVERTRLTPAACASAMGYVLPAFANAAQADGVVSIQLAENRIPLMAPESATVFGTVTVHEAAVSAGPLVTEIASALGAQSTTMTLSQEQTVPVRLQNGRVYHENFALKFGQTDVISSGSVGLDQTVNLVLDMPVPPKLLNSVLANNPRAREALANQRIKVPVGGTLQKPIFDRRGMDASVQALIRNTARDALTNAREEVRDKVREEIEKKAGKLPFPFGPKKP